MSDEIAMKFVGPPQQVCYAVAEEGYPAALKPGRIYLLSSDLAESLLRSSAHWARVEGGFREENGELVEYDLTPNLRAIEGVTFRESRVTTTVANNL